MIKTKIVSLFAVILFELIFSFKGYSQTGFTTSDETYNKNIKTVLLNPSNGLSANSLLPPVVPIEQTTPLVLEFDELGAEFKNYYVKIYNCNADWSLSTLSAVQYLADFNEFFINDRQISIGTRIPFIHYKFILPKVTLSGNYIVKVYRDYNEDDLIITKRFSVYESIARVYPEVKYSIDPSKRNTDQQVDFTIDYSKVDIINPAKNIQVVLRQNQRWDNCIPNLYPPQIDESARRLGYIYYSGENSFKGGNEFRVIDIRSSNFSGYNIERTQKYPDKSEAFVYPDKSRATEAYTQPLMRDVDGKFVIENYEAGMGETYADYMYVTFTLEATELANGKVYIVGGMTDWKLNRTFEMTYNSQTKKYFCQVLLKQGIYNYSYVLVNPATKEYNTTFFEGSHSFTQNQYDVLVYYRPFGSRSDLLIGYKNINYLNR